jgi:hypothetical protein
MGADFRDYDNDGLPDLSMTALNGETYPTFRNDGGGAFRDATYRTRIGPLSLHHSGWAVAFVDFNNDGWKDLFTANSHVNDIVEKFEPAVYRQANTVFENLRNGKFETAGCPALAAAKGVHRGAAFADFDADGRMDVAVSLLGEQPELWRNTSPPPGHWLILRLRGTRSNRDGIGAVVRIGSQVNHMTTSVGYSSSSHAGVHFGLGEMAKVDKIEIRWPSGHVQVLENVTASQVLPVTEP